MAKIKNVSSLGDLVIPVLNLEVPAGATVDVPDEWVESLLAQPSNWVSGESKSNKSIPDAATPADNPQE